MDVTFTCPCSCGAAQGKLSMFAGLNLASSRSVLAEPNVRTDAFCGACGCGIRPVDNISSIGTVDISAPRIEGLSNTSGPLTGNSPVVVTGHRMDLGTLVVRFAGIAGTNVRNRSATEATLDVPPGRMLLEEQGFRRRRLNIGTVSGTFQVGEIVTGGTFKTTASVREVQSTYLLVDTWMGPFEVTETLTGGSSGASATITGVPAVFAIGELATGLTSGATATVAVVDPLRVISLSGPFSAGEWVAGGTTGAKVQLHASTPMNGSVEVSVENENGRRGIGSCVYNGYQYSL